MRHLVEMVCVCEGDIGWPKRLKEQRQQQGQPLSTVDIIRPAVVMFFGGNHRPYVDAYKLMERLMRFGHALRKEVVSFI